MKRVQNRRTAVKLFTLPIGRSNCSGAYLIPRAYATGFCDSRVRYVWGFTNRGVCLLLMLGILANFIVTSENREQASMIFALPGSAFAGSPVWSGTYAPVDGPAKPVKALTPMKRAAVDAKILRVPS